MSQSLLGREHVWTQGNAVSWFAVQNIQEQTGQPVILFWILQICEVCLHADVLGAPPISLVFRDLVDWFPLFFFLFCFVFRRNIDTLLNSQCMIDSGAIRHYYDFFSDMSLNYCSFKLWSINKKERRKKKTIRERGYSYSASRNNRLVRFGSSSKKKIWIFEAICWKIKHCVDFFFFVFVAVWISKSEPQ